MPLTLYYSPGACSFAPHLVARLLGLELSLVKVDSNKRTDDGRDFWAINPKGYVPALELPDGSLLTEGPVISQYLADLKPEQALVPPAGTMARYRVQEMLGYINSELHKSYSPLFRPDTPDAVRAERREYLRKRYARIEDVLRERPYIVGDRFTVADAYLFTVTSWAGYANVDLSDLPALTAYMQRVGALPEVAAARAAESGPKR